MGISGTRGVLEKVRSLHTNLRLTDTKLVVDLTDPPYWFLKKRGLAQRRTDKFGTDFCEIAQFFRSFIQVMLVNNVDPIFVFSGVCLNKNYHSDLATKARHLEKSTRIQMLVSNRYGSRDYKLNSLCTNVLKLVIKEFPHLPKPVQAQYEPHPILQKLAEEYNCPVLTSHSEFIFKNIRTGFILLEDFPVDLAAQSRGILIPRYYRHQFLLQNYRLQNCSDALHTLYALLRPDVSGRYCKYINNFLRLQGTDLEIPFDDTTFVLGRPPRRAGNLTRRLMHILDTFQTLDVQTADQVRKKLVEISGDDRQFLKDYDSIHDTFEKRLDFSQSIKSDHEFVQRSALNNRQISKVNDSLVERCATANFLVPLLQGQTLFDNQLTYEDFSTSRSSYSMADPVRVFIMEQFGIGRVEILDRQFSNVNFRSLYAIPATPTEVISDRDIFKIFQFPESLQTIQDLKKHITNFQINLALKESYVIELVLQLLLVRFVFHHAFKENLDRERLSKGTNNQQANDNRAITMNYGRDGLMLLGNAIYNCFMSCMMDRIGEDSPFNMNNLENHPSLCDDSKGINFLPGLRLAKKAMDNLPPCSEFHSDYIKFKQVVEMLNSAIKGYCEISSLYEHITPTLNISKYYNPAQMFKTMSKMSTTKAENLLRLERGLEELLLS